jgi:microcystin-dependent protein
MADPFVAEIRIFPFNFAPKGWAFCNGQLLPISQNTALFSLVGTMYGGDGKSTFGLPNFQGRAPMFWGQGPGLSDYSEGEMSGSTTVTLLQGEMPTHNHNLMVDTIDPGDSNVPTNNALARSSGASIYNTTGGTQYQLAPQTLAPYGNSQPHNNMQPYLGLNFCIAMQGVFPPRG